MFSNIDVTSSPINFNLNSANSLETQQIVPQALRISADYWFNSYRVYAKVYSSSSSTSTPIPINLLGIKLRSVSPANSKANYNTLYLSTNNQLLIQAQGGWYGTDNWTYDMVLDPVGYGILPGTYNFTILFTMTQP